MTPLLQQPERWGKRERSDIVEEKGGRFFVSSYTSASLLSSSTGVFVSTPPFTARRSGHRLRVNPAYSFPLLASVFSMLFKIVDCVWCVYAGPGAAHERE